MGSAPVNASGNGRLPAHDGLSDKQWAPAAAASIIRERHAFYVANYDRSNRPGTKAVGLRVQGTRYLISSAVTVDTVPTKPMAIATGYQKVSRVIFPASALSLRCSAISLAISTWVFSSWACSILISCMG